MAAAAVAGDADGEEINYPPPAKVGTACKPVMMLCDLCAEVPLKVMLLRQGWSCPAVLPASAAGGSTFACSTLVGKRQPGHAVQPA